MSKEKETVSEALIRLIRESVEKGFELPLIGACIGVDDKVAIARITIADDGNGIKIEPIISTGKAKDPAVLPVNIFLTDARGRASAMLVTKITERPKLKIIQGGAGEAT